jgi:hypothetical protein
MDTYGLDIDQLISSGGGEFSPRGWQLGWIDQRVLVHQSSGRFASFENPSSNPLQRPEGCDFNTENAYRKPPVIV